MKSVAIIIVNWNGHADTIACLDSIRKLRIRDLHVETVVVDNGSENGSAGIISKAHPWATLITLDENRGFAGGNNAGMKYAVESGADYLWLLNNDTVVDPGALALTDAFADPDTGIAGSKIYFAAGHEFHADRYKKGERGRVIWYAGGIIDWKNMYASHRGVDEVDRGQYDAPGPTPYVSGCSMMIRREVTESVGFLDDRLYLYLEDLDYALRAKRHGYACAYCPASVLWHVNAGSSGGAGKPIHDYYLTRNRLAVGFRYAPVRTRFALVREAAGFLSGRNAMKRQAVLDALTGNWGKRRE